MYLLFALSIVLNYSGHIAGLHFLASLQLVGLYDRSSVWRNMESSEIEHLWAFTPSKFPYFLFFTLMPMSAGTLKKKTGSIRASAQEEGEAVVYLGTSCSKNLWHPISLPWTIMWAVNKPFFVLSHWVYNII